MAHLRQSSSSSRQRAARRAGFTLVELLVVIAVIGLVLLIALPGLSGMLKSVQRNAAEQGIGSMMSRAYFTATAEATPIAVRIFPGAWDAETAGTAAADAGRQNLALYRWTSDYRQASTGNLVSPTGVDGAGNTSGGLFFGPVQYFERLADAEPLVLPPDIWVAPAETTQRGTVGDAYEPYLSGRRDLFGFSSMQDPNFLDADDFLLVFDPRDGLVGGGGALPQPYLMKLFDARTPAQGGPQPPREWLGDVVVTPPDVPEPIGAARRRFERYAFTGVTLYDRTGFTALDTSVQRPASARDRRAWLQTNGRTYLVQRTGGGLVAAPGGS